MNIEELETIEGKVCSKCGTWKPLEEYHKRKDHKDGRQSKCKECVNKPPKETREGMKKCTKCGVWKPLEEYHKRKASKDGRASMCKKCRCVKKETKEGMKKCSKCGVWKPLEEYHKCSKVKDGRNSQCKECQKEYDKQHYQNNKEREKEQNKQRYQNNKEHYKEKHKQYYQNNKEYYKEYREDNKEHIKEQHKQHYQNNKEQILEQQKQRYQNNKEQILEQQKQHYQNNKQNNLQYISNLLEQINPVMKDLPVYGYIYKFENIKTGHIYIGQSIQPIDRRYGSNVIKSWAKERKEYQNQKFIDELIEEDIIVTELFDVACCEYHLDKLEAYWINYYDSCNNGYNNNAGYHDTDDGIEEFNQILSNHNLEFKDGKLIQIKAPTDR